MLEKTTTFMPDMTRISLAIDLGGTNLRLGLVDSKGHILKRLSTSVGEKRDGKTIAALIARAAKEIASEEWNRLVGAGIGIPGIVNSEKGIVYQSPHFPDWKEENFGKALKETLKIPVTIDNDANRAAIGEKWIGAAKEFSSFLMFTLGTGIGGALILDNKLWPGEEGFSGEVGHIVVESEGNPCGCGSRGCWETYASASGLRWYIQSLAETERKEFLKPFHGETTNVTLKELSLLAEKGFQSAMRYWERFGYYLGLGFASLIHVTGVYTIIVGGEVAKAWNFFYPSLIRELKSRSYKRTASKVRILPAKLGGDAGLLGNAFCAFNI